ncbi:MAG: hypothetical protein QOJ73_7567 [Streptosporangiaceae bacterium]|nr:hypothetical protein [Streptosporangiaceae bacterium]
MLTSRTPVDSGPDLEHLPGTPWSMRPAAASGGRAAMEMYDAGTLVDVMVARSLAPRILRGARSAVWAGQPRAVAWGCLPWDGTGLLADGAGRPADGTGLSVTFGRGHVRPRVRAIEVTSIIGYFWIALADGRFDSVAVTHLGTRERCRTRTARH